jgi:hypothetical protein
MADNEAGMRTVVTLSTGARVGATLALVLLLGAGYLFWSPIQLYPTDGFPIMCGTAATPPDNDLGTAACGDVNIIRQWQAGSLAITALVVALGSVYAFGVQRRREPLIGSGTPGQRGKRPSR